MNEPPVAVLAEDEAPQREALVAMLAKAWPALRVVVCEDGIAALEAVALHRPAVAFLDIRMPGVTGLDVARTVSACGGLVVFTTAYDDYALQAFETGAVDYLFKPVAPARLQQAVERVQARLGEATPKAAIDAVEAGMRPQGDRLVRWITASIGDSVRLIGIDEVVYFQAQDKYVRVVTTQDEALIRMPLKELAASLDPDTFWQVHRGLLVRVSAIDRVRRDELGRHALQLKGREDRLPVSAAFMQRFRGM